jgi:excisionase family DNA binding protein
MQQELVVDWLTVPEAAERLGTDVGKVRQLIRDRRVIAFRRGDPARLEVPAAFVHDGDVLKGLPGLLTLLSDADYDDDESLQWLFTVDDSLPGTPIQALIENRGGEVKRRAQALGF